MPDDEDEVIQPMQESEAHELLETYDLDFIVVGKGGRNVGVYIDYEKEGVDLLAVGHVLHQLSIDIATDVQEFIREKAKEN